MKTRYAVDDQHRSFRKIHHLTSAAMCQMMVDFAGSCSSRSSSREWLKKMRYLQHVEPQYRSNGDSAETFGHLGLSEPPSPSRGPHATFLELNDRSALPNSSAYVAVSYCWDRDIADWYDVDSDLPIEIIQQNGSTKRSRMPSDVLYRAFRYAKSRSIDAIWIDQECINQDDPADKEDAIQAMDLVYQKSAHPIAILESWFDTQNQVDIFSSIVDPGEIFEFDANKIEALADILSHFAVDRWFTRAWTLQESTSSGVRMLLLIGCPDLKKHDVFGPNPDEFEISIWDFQQAMVNARNLIEEGLANNAWENTSTAIHESNCADELWNRVPTNVPDRFGLRQEGSYRQKCNAAQAINFLAERYNSVFSDRLAILANLCDYETRINTRLLEDPSSSFSTCALTLAILNGDMSLLTGYGEAKGLPLEVDGVSVGDHRAIGGVYHSDDRSGFGFSWGPKPTAKLNNIVYVEENAVTFRLEPATLSADGLRVRGLLWHVHQEIMVHESQALFHGKWEQELESQIDDVSDQRQRKLMHDFTITLLHELLEKGFTSLAQTFWHFFEPYGQYITQSGSYKRGRSFPFNEVFGSRASLKEDEDTTSADLVEDLKTQWDSPSLFIHPDLQDSFKPPPHTKLVGQVCQLGKFLCGIPFTTSSSPVSSEPLVWFESAEMDDLVFTPFTQLGDAIAKSAYQYQAVSWAVQRTGKVVDGCEILHCLGRRRGFYRFEGLEPTVYILG